MNERLTVPRPQPRLLVLAVITAATSLGAVTVNPPAPEPTTPPDPIPPTTDPAPNVSTDDLANAIEVAEHERLEQLHTAELAAAAAEAELARQAAEAAAHAEAIAVAAAAERSTRVPASAAPHPVPAPLERQDVWWQLTLCESGGRQDAYNPAGPFFSYFQWLQSTWESLGGRGDPRNASYEEQLSRAQTLQARAGFRSQWPACSAKLGL
jgi:hypothetical protein